MNEKKKKDKREADISVNESVMSSDRQKALKNLDRLNRHHVHAVDILGSIGSGKTTLIQQLVRHLSSTYRVASIAGDLTTTIDADRIREAGGDVVQINTGGECHLSASSVHTILEHMNLDELDLLFIENVGNLICPSSFPLGTHQRMVVVSTTEGPYMIVKHPYIFMDASVVVINKMDLADIMEVDLKSLESDAIHIKPDLKVVFTNARTGQGIPDLIKALDIGVK